MELPVLATTRTTGASACDAAQVVEARAAGDVHTDPWGDYLVQHTILSSRLRWFVIDSGFFEHEDPEIHRLSLILTRIVAWNFVVITVAMIALVVDVFLTMSRRIGLIVLRDAVVIIAIAYIFFRASVRVIQTRNKRCCGRLTYMGCFQLVYVIAVVHTALGIVYHWTYHMHVDRHYLLAAGFFLNLILTTLAAEYARRLRRVLPPSPSHLATHTREPVHNSVVIVETES
mmetsp:Transcript_14167/g.44682  ORF Transcript_14167/g.44682 Transcript_14167/m.44682 type:complete len:230 (-) Transcript_14167:128-817(-)